MADWRFDRPTKKGEYHCILIYEWKGRKYAELGTRWFGEASEDDNWLMDGEPKSGLAWHEECGSAMGERVYAWVDMPKCDIKLPEGVEWYEDTKA